jgi:prepilin-type N-terminal cleavage/methylation domain-containing protein/prepilin-type processing-associated H-X9-DG protein
VRRQKAFTLIELLVVIAVIALLLSILMPSLQKAKKMAQSTVCQANVKQWGLIFRFYADDNEGKLPQSIAGGGLNSQQAYWPVATISYYEDKKIRICPSTKIVRTRENRSHGSTLAAWGPFDLGGPLDWWADFDTGSYGINEWCACPPPAADTYWGFPTKDAWRIIDTKGANRIPLFMDCVYVDVYPLENNVPLDFEPPPYQWSNNWGDWGSQAMRLICIDRHGGAINAAFLDGSVGKMVLRGLWKWKWHSSYNINGPWTRAGGAQESDWPDWMRNFRE